MEQLSNDVWQPLQVQGIELRELARCFNMVGYICETDTFAWDRPISEIRQGDILCIMNAGAYGYAMSSNYNARCRPAEVLVHSGKALLIRRREELDDLLATQRTLSQAEQQMLASV
ncbi:MAG: hypothetical protein KatS3mg040_1243 [Candidatus Kapaibacterium sp.]|nr:MAG: hypothetical protein KatS3mg040_1243 [Candidatus Kapabacteria bacterium]